MSQRDYHRLHRRVCMIYIVTSALYVLAGFVLSYQAYAQTRITNYITESPITSVPTGHGSSTVQAYYDYLWLRDLQQFTETYQNNPRILSWIYGILAGLIILFYFFIFAWYTRYKSHDLYPVEVYNGYISERASPIDPYTWAVSTIVFGYAVYYIVINLVFGQFY